MMTNKIALLAALALIQGSHAFVPSSRTVRSTTFMNSSPLEVVEDDPYENYTEGSALAYRETAQGSGEAAEDGNVLTVNFRGRLFSTGQ